MRKDSIKYVVLGIQFNHAFKVLDYWGDIADGILYNNSFFNEEYFTNISSQYTTERSVFNKKTGNSVRLTSNQLIFKYYIVDDFDVAYSDFCKKIEYYLVPEIIQKYDLIVRRLGVVFAKELDTEYLKKYAKKFFRQEINGITDFRFSQKDTSVLGRLWKDTDDYVNKIFTVGDIGGDDEFSGISYDFQLYFNPVQREIRDKIGKFLQEGLKKFESDVRLDI